MEYTTRYNITKEKLASYINGMDPLTRIKTLDFNGGNVVYMEKQPGTIKVYRDMVDNTYCKFRDNNGVIRPCPAKAKGLCTGMQKTGRGVSRAFLNKGESTDVGAFIDRTVNEDAWMLCNPFYNIAGKVVHVYTRYPERALLDPDY